MRPGILTTHKKFFAAYRKRFADLFVKVCHILNPQLEDSEFLREVSLEYYDLVFTDSERRVSSEALRAILHGMEERGVHVAVVLPKTFAVMTRDFVNYSVKLGDVVAPVNALTAVMLGSLGHLEHVDALEDGAISGLDGTVYTLLEQHADQALTVNALYRGVPISVTAVFLQADPAEGQVLVHLDEERGEAFEVGEEVMVAAPFLRKALQAKVFGLREEDRDLLLHELRVIEHSVHDRGAIRVQPPEPIAAVLKARQDQLPAQLLDLSVRGASLALTDLGSLEKGEWIQLEFELPAFQRHMPKAAQLGVRGEVRSISQRRDSLRVGLALAPTQAQESLISEYVTHRQSEVIRQVQPELHEPEPPPSPAERRDYRGMLALAIFAGALILVGSLLFFGGRKPEQQSLDWQATSNWLSKQRECQILSDKYDRDQSPQNLAGMERCERELRQLGGRVNP